MFGDKSMAEKVVEIRNAIDEPSERHDVERLLPGCADRLTTLRRSTAGPHHRAVCGEASLRSCVFHHGLLRFAHAPAASDGRPCGPDDSGRCVVGDEARRHDADRPAPIAGRESGGMDAAPHAVG